MDPTTLPPPPDRKEAPDLAGRLETWVSAGVIDRTTAEAIAAYESQPRPAPSRPRFSPVAEGLAYLGGALAVAAAIIMLGDTWDQLSGAVRIAVAAAIWLALLVTGWSVRRGSSPPLVRLSHVLWFLSIGAFIWTAGLVFERFDMDDQTMFVVGSAATTVYAGVLYLARPNTLQQIGLAVGVFLLASAFGDDSPTVAGWIIWLVGIGWIALGWRRVLVAPGAAAAIGSILILTGAIFVSIRGDEVGTWLAVVSSAGLIGAGAGLRHTGVMVIGTIALFFSTIGTIERYVEGTTGIAIGLLVAGALVSAVAFGVWRLGRDRRPPVGSAHPTN